MSDLVKEGRKLQADAKELKKGSLIAFDDWVYKNILNLFDEVEDQQATIDKLVEALDKVCDLALMPDQECPNDIQPIVSGYKDLINSVTEGE